MYDEWVDAHLKTKTIQKNAESNESDRLWYLFKSCGYACSHRLQIVTRKKVPKLSQPHKKYPREKKRSEIVIDETKGEGAGTGAKS